MKEVDKKLGKFWEKYLKNKGEYKKHPNIRKKYKKHSKYKKKLEEKNEKIPMN